MIKIVCIIGMTAVHMVFGKMRKELEKDRARKDSVYRIWNEAPTILMIIIVIMAVAEPI